MQRHSASAPKGYLPSTEVANGVIKRCYQPLVSRLRRPLPPKKKREGGFFLLVSPKKGGSLNKRQATGLGFNPRPFRVVFQSQKNQRELPLSGVPGYKARFPGAFFAHNLAGSSTSSGFWLLAVGVFQVFFRVTLRSSPENLRTAQGSPNSYRPLLVIRQCTTSYLTAASCSYGPHMGGLLKKIRALLNNRPRPSSSMRFVSFSQGRRESLPNPPLKEAGNLVRLQPTSATCNNVLLPMVTNFCLGVEVCLCFCAGKGFCFWGPST